MKFKRTIASILAATFSLTLIGQSVPKAFAEEISKTITEEKLDSNPPEKTPQEETPQKEATQKETAKEKASPNDQVTLDELKEKIKKIENEVTDLKKETGWSFKKGINAIKKSATSFVIFFACTLCLNILGDTLKNEDVIKGNVELGETLLNNIKSNKYKYFFNSLFSTSTVILYRFVYA